MLKRQIIAKIDALLDPKTPQSTRFMIASNLKKEIESENKWYYDQGFSNGNLSGGRIEIRSVLKHLDYCKQTLQGIIDASQSKEEK